MRHISITLAVLLAAGTARADDLAQTREVIDRHAAGARRTRITGGVAMIAAGTALGVAGYYMVDHAHGFLGDVDRAYGYSMLSVGGLALIAGPVLMLRRGEVEQVRDRLTNEQDASYVRTQIAHRAKQARGTRMIVRGIGATLLGVGGAGVLAASVGGDSIDRSTHNELMGAGIAVGLWGAGFVAASFVESRWEEMRTQLGQQPVPLTAGLIPVRGGAIAGVGGTF